MKSTRPQLPVMLDDRELTVWRMELNGPRLADCEGKGRPAQEVGFKRLGSSACSLQTAMSATLYKGQGLSLPAGAGNHYRLVLKSHRPP
jgi:hypothetical protein